MSITQEKLVPFSGYDDDSIVERRIDSEYIGPSLKKHLHEVFNSISRTRSKVTAAVLNPTTLKRPRKSISENNPLVNNEQSNTHKKQKVVHETYTAASSLSTSLPSSSSLSASTSSPSSSSCNSPVEATVSEEPIAKSNQLRITIQPHFSILPVSLPSPTDHQRLHYRIEKAVQTWGDRMRHIHPIEYLQHLLTTRGYDNNYIESIGHRQNT